MSETMHDQLQAYLAGAMPDRPAVQASDPVSISTGWESDVYAFDLESGLPTARSARRHEALVLRIYPGVDAFPKSGREFQGMQQLYVAGYPVPRVLLLERDASPFGKPFVVMERVEGQMMWEPLFRSSAPRQAQLLELFCDLFVRLHTLDWHPFVDDPTAIERSGPYAFADGWLTSARAILAPFNLTDTEVILAWLEARRDRVSCARPAPVHWDFHPGNILVRADLSATVIDWTQIQVSDPRFDLAWTLVLVGAAEGWQWRDRILAAYEHRIGAAVSELAWFEVAACAKRLFSVIVSLMAGPEALGMRPEAATLMRQQFGALRNVYGLFVERTGLRLRDTERLLEA
jgi:aminoglycoside phosphotransferase (APT) family kinase protein